MKPFASLLLLAASACAAAEQATYDSAGRVTALIDQGDHLPVLAHVVLVLETGQEVVLQPHDQRSPITREGHQLHWSGSPLDPLARGVSFDVRWDESPEGVAVRGELQTAFARRVRSVDFVVALPRDRFVGGRLGGTVPLPDLKPENPTFHREETDQLRVVSARGDATIELRLERPRAVRASDTWTEDGRFYELRVPLHAGAWREGETIPFDLALDYTARVEPKPVRLTLQPDQVRQEFLGFGANTCWFNPSPVVDYTNEHLRSTWLRFELKFGPWVAEREQPGEVLRRDFELMQRAQREGIPFIVSLWRIPEDYYVPRDAGASTMGHGRRIAPDRWDDFLRELGDYLVYLKEHYGAEPDMFSFNEPDLGVDIIFSPEEHRDAIKRIGAHFAALGLKTKQMLGETANPRDRHLYVLPTAADPEAMQYVAGVSFHSWHGATPEQYEAWAEVARWIQRPLFVGEAGMDPGAYRNRTYDSYTYGLREMKDHFDFVRYARANASLYWQFTNDYSLVRQHEDGRIEPTGRFHLMQHLNNLTPAPSQVLTLSSDDAELHALAFRGEGKVVLHLLNPGVARQAEFTGLPAGRWTVTSTTEERPMQRETWNGGGRLDLPARSMVTLIRE